jgi:threonine dehydratase
MRDTTKNLEPTTAELFSQITLARARIYRLFPPTPLEAHAMPGGWRMLLKREDLSPIHSYKWRGAFNFVSARRQEAKERGLAAASAGNHAQGVAVSAARLGLRAHLFMPQSAPRLKVEAVARLGGSTVEIHQRGDCFDDAAKAAQDFAAEQGLLQVPPYDDLLVMAGQGVIGDELMTAAERPDVVFVQIGGGGLAAGAAAAVKTYDPSVQVVGVEAEGQASMKAAFEAGEPTTLRQADIFCDGTAVKRAGALTFPLLRHLLDDLVVVSAREVAAAMETMWRSARALAEPSGALGLAAALRRASDLRGRTAAVILSGANLDFRRLGAIARRAGDPTARQAFYQVTIPERPGSMLAFLKAVTPLGLNISHLMVGCTDAELAFPVFGFDGLPEQFGRLEATLDQRGWLFQDVTSRPDLPFRVAPFQPQLFSRPFAAIFNFPERPGALAEFLERVAPLATISYFNYVHTGEEVGRALAVFSFQSLNDRQAFLTDLQNRGPEFTSLAQDTVRALGLAAPPPLSRTHGETTWPDMR